MELARILAYIGIGIASLVAIYLRVRYRRYSSRMQEQARTKEEEQARLVEEQPYAEDEYFGKRDSAPEFAGLESVRFHALWHSQMRPEVWQTLLVYVFSGPAGLDGARLDFRHRRIAPASSYDDSSSMSRQHIRRGTEISVYPELNGVRFNPPFAKVLWLEDWHCIEFRMQATERFAQTDGLISFYVGPILIGETQLYASATNEDQTVQPGSAADESFWEETGVSPYRAIFVSYSHEDEYIVDQLELAYRALGDEYLRDIAVLRSGEQWNPALLAKIRQANIFQLCWSESAKRSQYVEEEWRYALGLQRSRFIRPMYWEIPMPTPPGELSNVHFAYIRIQGGGNETST